jgi:tight adherence protein B
MRVELVLQLITLACGILAGVAVLRFWQSSLSPFARRFRERLAASLVTIPRPAAIAAAEGPRETQPVIPHAPRFVTAMVRYVAAARIPGSPSLVALAAASLLVGVTLLFVLLEGPWVLRLLGALVTGAAPVLYVRHRHHQTEKAIDRQLPEALDVMARSLQAGKSLPACWREMSEVLDEPLGPICREIHLKITYGGDLDDILRDTSQKIPSEDVRFFFSALTIFTRSGGNLVALLQDQSELLRQRLALRERIRALSSESRMSAWIMGLMPFFVSGLIFLLSPKTMALLWSTPLGVSMMEFGLFMQLLGVLWIARLASVRI